MARISGFVNGTYIAQSPTLNAMRTVNLIPVREESGTGTNIGMLLATPGLIARTTGLQGAMRGQLAINGRHFCVAGTGFYEFNLVTGVATLLGTVLDDALPASLSSNGDGGNQIFIVAGLSGYTYNTSTGVFAIIADVDFPNGSAVMGWFSDGYFFVLKKDTAIFQISDLEDGTTWDGLDVAEKSITADRILAGCVVGRTIWLMGQQSIEPWYDSGDTFPFTPVPGAVMRPGILAPWSLAKLGDVPYFLGGGDTGARVAYQGTSSSSVKRISNTAVEQIWDTYTRADDAEGFAYEDRGGRFYWLTFPAANRTWVFDGSTETWHERGLWNTKTGDYDADLPRTHAYVNGQHLVGSRAGGTLYRMTFDALDQAGTARRWLRRFQLPIRESAAPTFYQTLTLIAQTGVGTASGQGSDPQVMLRFSDDDGNTWSAELWASLGQTGQYGTTVEWRRLGRALHGRIYELSGSDPVITALVNVLLRAA
jgi:hypothetical protein